MGVKALRQGFSTGACAAAACAAAWRRGRGERIDAVDLAFPDGQIRTLALVPAAPAEAPSARPARDFAPNPAENPAFEGRAAVIKDGGDDPDETHGATIHARLRPADPDEATERDYLLAVGGARLILRAAEGVGLCTRPGLDCEPGKWAINVVPRRMIAENLGRAGMNAGVWLAEIGVERGAELAKRTLNSRLGVIGGLSILGTSGIVRPYSHEAYAATIRLCARALREEGGREVVFCTGGRTRAGAQRLLPDLPETAFVPMGDFIGVALTAARECGLSRITVACMPGKLCKYAAGLDNTHARRADQDLALLQREAAAALAAAGPEQTGRTNQPERAALPAGFASCASVREALPLLPADVRPLLLRRLADAALRAFAARPDDARGKTDGEGENETRNERIDAAPPRLRLLVFDVDGHLLLDVDDGNA